MRAPTPSAAAELVVAAKDDFCGRIERLHERLNTAARQSVLRRHATVQALVARRAFAGTPARLAMHGRHASELTHQLKRAVMARLARQEREFRSLRQRLEANNLARRFAVIRGRLRGADERLRAAAVRGRDRADSRFRVLVGRLDNLSPLAVLARGYAVCWNAERTSIIRRAAALGPGDRVRVTLHEGELHCEVKRPPEGGRHS